MTDIKLEEIASKKDVNLERIASGERVARLQLHLANIPILFY